MRKKEKTKPSSRRANEIKKGLKDAITYERGDKTRARVVYPSADDYTRHEAMHMAHVILNMIDNELFANKAIKCNKAWNRMAGEAFNNLFELYQSIGAVHMHDRK